MGEAAFDIRTTDFRSIQSNPSEFGTDLRAFLSIFQAFCASSQPEPDHLPDRPILHKTSPFLRRFQPLQTRGLFSSAETDRKSLSDVLFKAEYAHHFTPLIYVLLVQKREVPHLALACLL